MADRPANEAPYRLIHDVEFGSHVVAYSFTLLPVRVGGRSSIGSGAVALGGVTIGEGRSSAPARS